MIKERTKSMNKIRINLEDIFAHSLDNENTSFQFLGINKSLSRIL